MDPGNVDVERLLAEAPWLRRLARGLVRGEAAAEDLSQEVLAAALNERPDLQGLSGVGLRSWLRTVARRLAGRSRERDAARREVEARVARPDPDEAARGADERLELHRRLSAALDRLPPLYRTALVLRYLEELPPRDIAARLGIPDTAARKRVSRGLALLREELDRHFGGRDEWLAALVPLIAPAPPIMCPVGPTQHTPRVGAAPLVHRLASLPEVTIMGLSLPKLALLGVAAVGAVALWTGAVSRATRSAALSASGPEAALVAPAESADGERPAEVLDPPVRSAARAEVEAPPTVAVPEGPRVRVVDESGQPVVGARAARLHADGRVAALELDEGASARWPEGSGWTRVAAGAEGYASRVILVGDSFGPSGPSGSTGSTGDLEVVLSPERVLRGRLTEEGLPPSAPLWLSAYGTDDLELGASASTVSMALAELGVLPGNRVHRAAVDQQGSFELRGLRPGQELRILLPQTHVLRSVDGRALSGDGVRLGGDADEVVLDTVRLPEVYARVVWDDDGSPVQDCMATVLLPDHLSNGSMAHSVTSAPDGVVRVGLPVPERVLFDPGADRFEAIRTRRVDLLVHTTGSEELLRQVELEGARFPLDAGELRLVRKSVVRVSVRDTDGRSVQGAWVHVGGAPTNGKRTGPSGEVELAGKAGEAVQVLAEGFAYVEERVPAPAAGSPTVALDLVLEPGRTLVVHLGELPEAVRSPLRIAWDEPPFEGFRARDHAQEFARFGFHGRSPSDGIWNQDDGSLPVPISGERVVVPGLRAGARLRLELLDCLKQVLAERTVEVPDEPGTVECTLGLEPGQAGVLELVLEDPVRPDAQVSDELTGRGRVFQGQTGSSSLDFRGGVFRSGSLRPGSYDVELWIDGYLPVRVEAVEVGAGVEPRHVRIAPSRSLTLVVRDATGRPLEGLAAVVGADIGREVGKGAKRTGDWRLGPLPREELEVEVRIGTGRWTRVAPPGVERLELELPVHGRLAAVWPVPTGAEGDVALALEITPAGGGSTARLTEDLDLAVAEQVELAEDLLPGDYVLSLSLSEHGPEGQGPWRELVRRTVSVSSEGETRVTLE